MNSKVKQELKMYIFVFNFEGKYKEQNKSLEKLEK
jgi:hypothetical protein